MIQGEEVKISTLTGIWKKLIPIFMNDFEGFKISAEEGTADVVKTARELEFKAETEYVINLMTKTLTDEELLLMDEQRKWFLEM